jgi:hypothetical protein
MMKFADNGSEELKEGLLSLGLRGEVISHIGEDHASHGTVKYWSHITLENNNKEIQEPENEQDWKPFFHPGFIEDIAREITEYHHFGVHILISIGLWDTLKIFSHHYKHLS